jgi:MFS family permease
MAVHPYPRRLHAWVALLTLVSLQIVQGMDQQIISLMVSDLRSSLHISAVSFGSLATLPYLIAYIFAGMPLSYVIDRGAHRRQILPRQGSGRDLRVRSPSVHHGILQRPWGTMAEALSRLGPQWTAVALRVQRNGWQDDLAP